MGTEATTKTNGLLDYSPTDLKGKRVLLTGGTTGIGRATAIMLAGRGARLFTFGRHQEQLDEALKDIESVGGEAYGSTADSSKEEDIARMFDEAETKLGGIDILINNAAIGAEGVGDMPAEDIRYTVETNLLGYLVCAREGVRRMKKGAGGHIVNIGSMSADVREEGSSVYVATKSAIQGFSEALRKEVNGKGIKVTLIEPGLVGTDMTLGKGGTEAQEKKQEDMKMLRAEDIAACVCYTLEQPERCDVVSVQIRPHLQKI